MTLKSRFTGHLRSFESLDTVSYSQFIVTLKFIDYNVAMTFILIIIIIIINYGRIFSRCKISSVKRIA